MTMPRTLREILEHADELADRFEAEDFGADSRSRDATTLRELSRAVQERALAEARVAQAVAVARADGSSWSAIGLMLGTSGEAARQRYGNSESGQGPALPEEIRADDKLVELMAALEASVEEARAARSAAADAQTKRGKRRGVGQVYKRSDGKWAFRVRASNGEIVATDGGQGYSTKGSAQATLEKVLRGEYDGPIVVDASAVAG